MSLPPDPRWPSMPAGDPEPSMIVQAMPVEGVVPDSAAAVPAVPPQAAGWGAPAPAGRPDARPSVVDLQTQVRDSAREIMGIGTDHEVKSLRKSIRLEGLSVYPALAVLALSSAQGLSGSAQATLLPEIGRTLGFGLQGALLMGVVTQAVGLVLPLAISRTIGNRPWRARALIGASVVYALCVLAGGLVPTALIFALFLLLDQATTTVAVTVDQSLIMDLYPPRTRVRFMAFQASSSQLPPIVGTFLVLILVAVTHLTWRGVYVVFGVIVVLLTAIAVRLRDPGFGRYDEGQLAGVIEDRLRESGVDVDVDALEGREHRRLLDVCRGLWLNRPMRLSLLAMAFSNMTMPLQTAYAFFLTQQQDYSTADLAVQSMAISVSTLLGIWLLAPFGERLYAFGPQLVFKVSGVLGALSMLSTLVLLVSNTLLVNTLIMAVPAFFTGLTVGSMSVGQMQLVRPDERHYLGSVFQIVSLGGMVLGGLLIGGTVDQIGLTWAIIIGVSMQLGQLLFSFRSGDAYMEGLDGEVDEFVEDLVARAERAAGLEPAALECTNITFSYGSVEVLHGIDLTVREGEILALLGVNGSGKSTLLRLVAGIETPDEGTIRCFGYDVTYTAAEHRARDGVLLMRGGQGIFPSLTVRQNLLVCKHASPDSDPLESALTRFPALRPLLDRRAGDLSGGEAQMLALARVFLLRPRLLLIDELSLGLAPKIVADLLEHVRQLNRDGTTIVVVEQSLNLAAQIAERAVFLEQGRARFEGPTHKLAERPDLARAVFLGKAAL